METFLRPTWMYVDGGSELLDLQFSTGLRFRYPYQARYQRHLHQTLAFCGLGRGQREASSCDPEGKRCGRDSSLSHPHTACPSAGIRPWGIMMWCLARLAGCFPAARSLPVRANFLCLRPTGSSWASVVTALRKTAELSVRWDTLSFSVMDACNVPGMFTSTSAQWCCGGV